MLRDTRLRRGTGADDVGQVNEGTALGADVHEGGLHSRHDPQNPPGVDIPHDASARLSLDVNVLRGTVLDHGDACLHRGDVDEDLRLHGALFPIRGSSPAASRSARVSTRGRPITLLTLPSMRDTKLPASPWIA